ncbi:retrovirus-related pol polyprotein from transposon TNT 1-94, partial [Tanacetum coccineum]
EQWFNLHKDLLRDALDITPTNNNNPFVAPPSSDTVKLLDMTDQDILYYRSFGVSFIAPTLTMLKEEGGATESSKATKVTKPKATKVTKPTGDPAPKNQKLVKETPDDLLPAKRSKAGLVGKSRKAKSLLRLIDEPSDEGVPVEEPSLDDEEADLQRALELSLKEQGERTQGPTHPVVLREPDSGKFQLLPEVQGKGKEKVVEEQVAHDLL